MPTASWKVTSPNGRLVIEVAGSTDVPAPLTYRVVHDGMQVVDPSPLGIASSAAEFVSMTVRAGATRTVQDSYELAHGKRRRITAIGSESVIEATNPEGLVAHIVLRAYDDAVAFRYRLQSENSDTTLVEEYTGFAMPAGRVWIQPHDRAGHATPAYEAEYANGITTGTPSAGPSWNLPALFEVGERWALIAESDLGPDGFGAHLSAIPAEGVYRIVPPEADEALGLGDTWPTFSGVWESPWRVIVVGGLAEIVETTAITDLARPSLISRPTWVQPGRVSWSWWSDHDSPRNLETLRSYIDFAAEMGWEHTLIDANWNVHDDADMRRLVAYAAERGIGVFLWYNSGGPNNEVGEQPRDRMFDPAVRREQLMKLAEWGVAGIKVDFFHSDKQEGIARMWAILEDTAEQRLMVNFHGCTVPRGWQRTWPHLMTMEGVRGAEQYSFASSYPAAAVWHNTILPYTRNTIGPMDYTPVTFSHSRYPRHTSDAHELALAVAYESGLQHFADSANAYRKLPSPVRDLLGSVPAVWDDTRFLAGRPGESFVVARRHGHDWWIAGINGRDPLTIDGELDFIPGLNYGVLVTDGPDGLVTSDVTLDDGETFKVTMGPAGGFLLHIPGE